MPKKKDKKLNFDESTLSTKDREDYLFAKNRIPELQKTRENVRGVKLDELWTSADADYIPHRLTTPGRKILVSDDDKGWRSSLVTLGKDNWQSDVSQPNPYIKIQTAISILIDRNPTGVFLPGASRYEATTNLMAQLYAKSWEKANSKQQLKLFIFNLAKYGWAIGRTYPLKISRSVKELTEYNEDSPNNSTWAKKEITEYNDIFRENLDPFNAWIDDMTRPNNPFSQRDWCWRKVYPMDVAAEEFGKYKNWKYVTPGGVTTERIGGKEEEKRYQETDLVEIQFYENRIRDSFVVDAGNVPLIIDPLPISDSVGNKKLSCWHAFWNIRHAECPYGIGIYEAMRYDQALYDRISNMTIDQLTLSIYKMFFYTGTERLTESGDIKIRPGVGKQVLDPKNINWLTVPGPGRDAWEGVEMMKKRIDDASGVTPPLMGEVTGKTAFEIATAKESALKRLKAPLDNICDALETEAYITVSLTDLLYSIPETYTITDPDLIDKYLQEIQSDKELYEYDKDGNFVAKVYRELQLNLEEDEKGNLMETNESRFFRIKPKFLKWDGIINIKPQSILTPSKQLDKVIDNELDNMLIPLIGTGRPDLYGKIAKNMVKRYDKDPKDVLPEVWMDENPQAQKMPGMPGEKPVGDTGQGGGADKMVNMGELPQAPKSLPGRIMNKISKPFANI